VSAPGGQGRSPSGGPAPPDDLAGRLRGRRERVHVLTGRSCNNNCLFCMEEDRAARAVANAATDDRAVRRILADNPGVDEVCFTSGEPTTNPALPRWARWARDAGVRRVSVMTNGRALAYPALAARLVEAGVGRFYVSLHGHTARLHDSLTRTPGSFAQTVAGLDNLARLADGRFEVHTATALTVRVLPHLDEIYQLVRARRVAQAVFNGLQISGRAETHFDRLVPRYREVAAAAAVFLAAAGRREPRVEAFLVDLPPCTTHGLPDYNRGYVEAYAHYEPAVGIGLAAAPAPALSEPGGASWLRVTRADLDAALRAKREACGRCRYDPVCEGVWAGYLRRHGWDELEPVE
jgi:cyclic pyranopterin phosphate synthase